MGKNVKILLIGYNLELFTEGYSRLFLRFGEVLLRELKLLRFKADGTLLNINNHKLSASKVFRYIAPYLSGLNVIDFRSPSKPNLAIGTQILYSLLNAHNSQYDLTLINGNVPFKLLTLIRFLIARKSCKGNKVLVFLYGLRRHLQELLRRVSELKLVLLRNCEIFVFNPYISEEYYSLNLKLVRVFPPPLDPIFVERIDKFIPKARFRRDGMAVFRVMGRAREFSTLLMLIKAFKDFSRKLDKPNSAYLVIDQFHEDADKTFCKQYKENIKICLDNPFKADVDPLIIVWKTMLNYVNSSYIILPFIVEQFVQPSLTLLESLALGTPVVGTPTVLRFFPYRDLTFQIDPLDVKSTAKTFEELYELYMHNPREYHRLSEKAVATMRSLYEEAVNAVAKTLKE